MRYPKEVATNEQKAEAIFQLTNMPKTIDEDDTICAEISRLKVAFMSDTTYDTKEPTTNQEKFAAAYRAQEVLRLEHNQKAQDCKDGKITLTDMRSYQQTEHKNKLEPILAEIRRCRAVFQSSTRYAIKLSEI